MKTSIILLFAFLGTTLANYPYPPPKPHSEYGPPPVKVLLPVPELPPTPAVVPKSVYGPPKVEYGPPKVVVEKVYKPAVVYGSPKVQKPVPVYGAPKIEVPKKPVPVYGPPKVEVPRRPVVEYGPPKVEVPKKPVVEYGPTKVELPRKPVVEYGPPKVEYSQPRKPVIEYGPPKVELPRKPVVEYGPPKVEFQKKPLVEYRQPATKPTVVYGVPHHYEVPQHDEAPQVVYGVPEHIFGHLQVIEHEIDASHKALHDLDNVHRLQHIAISPLKTLSYAQIAVLKSIMVPGLYHHDIVEHFPHQSVQHYLKH